jgi:hypothetical protein
MQQQTGISVYSAGPQGARHAAANGYQRLQRW